MESVASEKSDREAARCGLGLHGSVERVVGCVFRFILEFGRPEFGRLPSRDSSGTHIHSTWVNNLHGRGLGRWRHDRAHAIGEDEEDIILVVGDHRPVGFRQSLPVALVGLVEVHIVIRFRKESAVLVLRELDGGIKLLLEHGHGRADADCHGGGDEEEKWHCHIVVLFFVTVFFLKKRILFFPPKP